MKLLTILPLLMGLSAASAESVLRKDRYLRSSSAGDMAWVLDNVQSIGASKSLLALQRNTTTEVARKPVCIVAVAHRDAALKGTQTFVGIQLVKVFSVHGSPGVIHVIRNGQWYGRDDGRELQPFQAAVGTRDTSAFAAAHASADTLADMLLSDGSRNVATSWHARVAKDRSSPYSADREFLEFWQKDPLRDSVFAAAHPGELRGSMPVRIENRLLRFTLTESWNPSNLPSFEFDCKDPALKLVAIRLYLPFKSDVAWTYLQFK